jgi:hypothetical protein
LQRREIAAIIVSVILFAILLGGVFYQLWSPSTVLSYGPYFLLGGVVVTLSWGFGPLILAWFPARGDSSRGPTATNPASNDSLYGVEPLFNSEVKVAAGVHVDVPLLLQDGERVEGTAVETYGADFDCYLFDDRNYALFYGEKGGIPLDKQVGSPAAHIDSIIPHSGTWHLVLDAGGRRRRRRIEVRLTRKPKFVVDAEANQRARRIASRPSR